MAISIHSETTGTGTGNGSNQVSISKPSSVSNGDYLVVIIGADDDAPSIAPPGDWTLADADISSSGNDRQIAICYKKITDAGSEPSTYTFTLGSGDNAAWWIGALSGVDQDTPEDEAFSGNSTTRPNDQSPVTPTITTANNNCFVLAGWATNYCTATDLPGSPWASRLDDSKIGSVCVNVVSQTQSSAGNIDAELLNMVESGQETSCGIWAFRQAVVTNREVNVNDSVGVSEYVKSTINPLRTPLSFESLVVDEFTNQRVNPLRASVFDEVVVTETTNLFIPLFMSVFDQVAIEDVSNLFLKQLSVSAYDQVTIADYPKSFAMRHSVIAAGTFVQSPNRGLVVTQDGTLHSFYKDDTPSNVYHSYSSDLGLSWSEEAITTGSTYEQGFIKAATDSKGNIHVVWVGKTAAHVYNNIRYRKYTKGSGWGSIVEITEEDISNTIPGISTDSSDNPHLVWQHNSSPEMIYYRKSSDGGSSWDSIVNLTSGESTGQIEPCIAIDSNNYIHVAWVGVVSGISEIRYKKYTDSWSGITEVTSSSLDWQYGPDMAVDSSDNIHLTWFGYWDEENYYYQVRYRKYSGSWETIQNLTDYGYNCEYPSISVDKNNTVYIVYHEDGGAKEDMVILRYISSWEEYKIIGKTVDMWSASPMWAYWPQPTTGVSPNVPLVGFAFIFTYGSIGSQDLYFGCSSDFNLQFRGVPDPVESVTMSDEISTFLKQLSLSVDESISVTEWLQMITTGALSVTGIYESIAVSEFVSEKFKQLLSFVYDQITLNDTPTYPYSSRVNDDTSYAIKGLGGTDERQAQTVYIPTYHKILQLSLLLENSGSPTDNLVASLFKDVGTSTLDSGLFIGSAIKAGSEITSKSWYTLTFEFEVWPGWYSIVLSRSGTRDESNYYLWHGSSESAYAGGISISKANSVWSVI